MDDDELPESAGAARRLNLLYLIGELERAVNLGGIVWDAGDANRIPERLTDVASTLRRQAGN